MAVANAFINVLRQSQNQRVAEQSVISLQSHVDDATNLHRQGFVPLSDVLAARASLSNAQSELINAENSVSIARSGYNRLLYRPLDTPVNLEEPRVGKALALTPAELTKIALERRAELHALGAQEAALRRRSKATQAVYMPQVSMNGGYQFIENRNLTDEGYWSVGVGLQWQLFDGNSAHNESQALIRRAEHLYQQRRDLAAQIKLEVRQSLLNLAEARKRITVAKDAVAQAKENLRVTRDRYEEGLSNDTRLLDAQSLYTRSASNLLGAHYDEILARLQIERAAGLL